MYLRFPLVRSDSSNSKYETSWTLDTSVRCQENSCANRAKSEVHKHWTRNRRFQHPSYRHTIVVSILNKHLHFLPDLASSPQDLSVNTLFAWIGQKFRKLHFLVTRNEMLGYMIVRWSVIGYTFGRKHAPWRWVEHIHHTPLILSLVCFLENYFSMAWLHYY